MDKEKTTAKSLVAGGIAFAGCGLAGLGIGVLTDTALAGVLIGMGIGLLVMATIVRNS